MMTPRLYWCLLRLLLPAQPVISAFNAVGPSRPGVAVTLFCGLDGMAGWPFQRFDLYSLLLGYKSETLEATPRRPSRASPSFNRQTQPCGVMPPLPSRLTVGRGCTISSNDLLYPYLQNSAHMALMAMWGITITCRDASRLRVSYL